MTARMKYRLIIGVEVQCPDGSDGWTPLVLPAVEPSTQMDLHWRRPDPMRTWAATRGRAGRRTLLTPREIEVLRLVAEGRTDRQIAREFDCSPRTVHSHMYHLIHKFRATSRAHAVVLGIRAGLIPLDPANPTRAAS